jgi:hypothetical protein
MPKQYPQMTFQQYKRILDLNKHIRMIRQI